MTRAPDRRRRCPLCKRAYPERQLLTRGVACSKRYGSAPLARCPRCRLPGAIQAFALVRGPAAREAAP